MAAFALTWVGTEERLQGAGQYIKARAVGFF
jgi:hypothetical protein